jgi:2-polyprenyl-3-methyl-5-hydroxy-6-metoxy-1,4-benzoquinol methylase
MTPSAEIEAYHDWLERYPVRDFFRVFSPHRGYQTPEDAYDADASVDDHRGRFLVEAVSRANPNLTGVCLEIGCGTGRLTSGLVRHGAFERYLITDASAAFLEITRDKLLRGGVAAPAVDFGLFNGEDFDEIGFEKFALIALRSVLHHIADYEAFFCSAASKVKPGGIVAILEPRAEFFVHTSTLLRLMPALAAQGRVALDPGEAAHIEAFQRAAQFYLSRTLDKSHAEDKYAFTGDELVDLATQNGMILHRMGGEYGQNYAFDVHDYLRYCMGFPEPLMGKIDRVLGDAIRHVDELTKELRPVTAAEWLVYQRGS